MKNWKDISKGYPDYLKNNIKNPQPRLSALVHIEAYIKAKYPKLLSGEINLSQTDKNELKDQYKIYKGKILNGAEEQVFNDFYNVSKFG